MGNGYTAHAQQDILRTISFHCYYVTEGYSTRNAAFFIFILATFIFCTDSTCIHLFRFHFIIPLSIYHFISSKIVCLSYKIFTVITTKSITVRDVDSIERDIIQKQHLRTSMRHDVDRESY